MKILLIISGLSIGGAERQVVDLADGFLKKGHIVKICFLTGPCLVRPSSSDIELIGLNMRKSIFGFISGYIELRKLIHLYQPDVVHSHMIHANILARLLRISIYIPRLISTSHTNNDGGILRSLAYRVTAGLADINTNVSDEAVKAFERKGIVSRGKMISVTNGIDTVKFAPNPTVRTAMRKARGISCTDRVILAIGSFSEAKDYPNLFNAYRLLRLNGFQAQLWIIGDGDLRFELEQLVEQLNLNDHIYFLGIQNNISDWLNAVDVFVLASAWEGLPLVVGEAMACEKFVVTTNAGGVSEFLGNCGFLVPTQDAEALSLGLKNALDMLPDELAAYGRRSRERILNNFSISEKVNQWLSIYIKNNDFNYKY